MNGYKEIGGVHPKEPSGLTVRGIIFVSVIGFPLTYGFFLLCEHLEGVDKPGWVWWPSLFGLLFTGAWTVDLLPMCI